MEIDPSDYKSLLNRGIALDQLGNFEEAIEHYDQIISNLAPLIENGEEEIPKFEIDVI